VRYAADTVAPAQRRTRAQTLGQRLALLERKGARARRGAPSYRLTLWAMTIVLLDKWGQILPSTHSLALVDVVVAPISPQKMASGYVMRPRERECLFLRLGQHLFGGLVVRRDECPINRVPKSRLKFWRPSISFKFNRSHTCRQLMANWLESAPDWRPIRLGPSLLATQLDPRLTTGLKWIALWHLDLGLRGPLWSARN